MKIKEAGTGLISGKIGNLIYYVMNGKQYVRRTAIPGKKRKAEVEGRNPKHQGLMKRFSGVQSFYAFFKKYVSEEIWQIAGVAEQYRPNNLFNKTNCRCFDEQGNLVDFATFYFSRGELPLPRNIKIEKEDNQYQVSWEEEREGGLPSPDDRLCVGIIYDNRPGAPCLVEKVSGKRGDLKGKFALKKPYSGTIHAYCFWVKKDGSAYSNSFYVRLEGT
ncbi:hypothetical protein [Odoribacter lunatus]|uniref:hypothetical protein n=1 Tax=Odoribacter lunatus TaxID=2941335 RepID=UPI00203DFF8C|nr:hypothetical protein [Odoribacter lunatus]